MRTSHGWCRRFHQTSSLTFGLLSSNSSIYNSALGETGAVNIHIKKKKSRVWSEHIFLGRACSWNVSAVLFCSIHFWAFCSDFYCFYFIFPPGQNQSGQTRDRLPSESETIKPGGAAGTRRPVQFFDFFLLPGLTQLSKGWMLINRLTWTATDNRMF